MTKLSFFPPLLGAPGLSPADAIFRPKKTKKVLNKEFVEKFREIAKLQN